MAELGPAYFQEAFDPVAGEMARLPPAFDAALLDALVDRRSWVLEVRLSPLPLPPPPPWAPPPQTPPLPSSRTCCRLRRRVHALCLV